MSKDLEYLRQMFETAALWNDNGLNYIYKVTSFSGLAHTLIQGLRKKGFKIYNVSLMSPMKDPSQSYCQILLEKKIK